MSALLFFWLFFSALASRSVSLAVSGMVYCFLSTTHYSFYVVTGRIYSERGFDYYVSAAVIDFACVVAVCISKSQTGKDGLLFPLAIVMASSIVNNLFGLVSWFYNIEMSIYNSVGFGLYSAVALILAGSRFTDGRIFKAGWKRFINSISALYGAMLGNTESARCTR